MRLDFNTVKNEAQSLIDTGKYAINFGIIPGCSSEETNSVQNKCYRVSLPSESVEVITVNIHGHEVTHRGLAKQEKIFTASFYNSSDAVNGVSMDAYRAFHCWLNKTSNIIKQSSEAKTIGGSLTQLTRQSGTEIGQAINNLVENTMDATGLNNLINIPTTKKNLYSRNDVYVDVYDQNNSLQIRYFFYNVFPIKIEGTELGGTGGTGSEMLSTTVTFSFDYFLTSTILETDILKGDIEKGIIGGL